MKLSLREKAAQMIMPEFRFDLPDYDRVTGLVRAGVGGVCLYGGSVFEVPGFVNSLQNLAKLPLLVASDFETGAGHQVKGATRLPSNMAVGAAGSEELAELKGRVTAREARVLGVRWVFAPVLDLQIRAENPIVNVRSFGSDPARAAALGRAFARGCRAEAVLACGKHYPGHGDVTLDSHIALPTLDDHAGAIDPFVEALEDLDSIMSAHLLVRSLDPEAPVSLSERAVAGHLRGRLGYGGLVVTDALMMGGVTSGYTEADAVVRAVRAGNDVVLYPADSAGAIDAIVGAVESGRLTERILDAAVQRLLDAKRRLGLHESRIVDPESIEAIVGSEEHRAAAERIAQASVTRIRGEFPVGKVRVALAHEQGGSLEAFRSELERLGCLDDAAETGVIALSVQVRAFSGKIKADPAVLAGARARLAGVKRIVLVTFGSPYDHRHVDADAGLAVYDDSEASQLAAARALVGRIPTPGTLPVAL